MSPHIKIKNINRVFDWCVKYYGKSKYYKSYPTLVISYSKKSDYHGEFFIDDSDLDSIELELILYVNNLSSNKQIVQTMIHEYQHYLQNPSWLTRHYRTKSYENNPYELQAEKEANQTYKLVIEQLNL